MRLRQIVERRVSTAVSGTSLRPLSAQEIKHVAGAVYFGDGIIGWPLPPEPFPGNPYDHAIIPNPIEQTFY